MRQRTQSEKEPIGKTKSHILLYIADTNKVSYPDIRSYLIDSINIRNNNVIRTHLADLEGNGLLIKKSNGIGRPDFFYLEGFDNFKRLFNFFKETQQVPELMKTKHFKSYIESEEFLPKLLVNFYKENILQFYNSNKEFVDPKNKEFPTAKYHHLIEIIQTKEVDELLDLYIQYFENNLQNIRAEHKSYLLNLDEYISSKRKDIIEILTSSPSAIDFALNPSYLDQMLLSNITGYLLNTQLEVELFNSGLDLDVSYIFDSAESPIFLFFKSIYTADVISKKTLRYNDLSL